MVLRCVILLALLAATSNTQAENWPNWRGPDHNGVAPGQGFATTWNKQDNVQWQVPLEGRGGSTPIVWGDHIYVTTGNEGRNLLLCFDRQGKAQWQVELGSERPGKHKKASGANPSPVTDGQHVYVYFKSGDLACVTPAGKLVWQKNIQDLYGEDTLWWDLGTSPVLTDKYCVVAVMHSGPSFLVALDKQSGEVAWKADRNLNAPEEAAQSYTTPVLIQRDGRELLITLGADHVTAHDAQSGKELWRVGGLNPTGHKYFRSISSPVVWKDYVIAPYARGNTVTCIRLGGQGDVTDTHVVWTKEELGADVPTPVAADGKTYICTDKGKVSCLEIATGKTLWEGELEKNRHAFSASPILADEHLYLTREDGATFVLQLGDQFKVVAKNELDDTVVATPALVDSQILIRSFDFLYCIGK